MDLVFNNLKQSGILLIVFLMVKLIDATKMKQAYPS